MAGQTLTKTEHLREQIKRELVSSRFVPGSRFYSINELVERYDVAPGTAHKALKELVKNGNLTGVRGRGYVVNSQPDSSEFHDDYVKSDTKTITYVGSEEVFHSQTIKILNNIQSVCAERAYRLELLSDSTEDFLGMMKRPDIAGVVWHGRSERLSSQIKKPVVAIGHYNKDGVVAFAEDAFQSNIEAVRYLRSMGHRRIASLLPDSLSSFYIARQTEGLRNAYEQFDLPWDDDLIKVYSVHNADPFYRDFVANFQKERITAAIVGDWEKIMVLIDDLRQANLDVPRDLSIMSYGNSEFTERIRPKITRVAYDIDTIAKQMIESLLAHIEGEKPLPQKNLITFPVQVVLGHSTDMAPQCST